MRWNQPTRNVELRKPRTEIVVAGVNLFEYSLLVAPFNKTDDSSIYIYIYKIITILIQGNFFLSLLKRKDFP